MAVRVPEAVREAWGDEAVMAFLPWLEEILTDKAILRDEYRQVLSRLDVLEKDVALIKDEQVRMRSEFRENQAQMRAEFRQGLNELRREMNERFDRINERFDRMNERFDRMNERFDRMESAMGERFDTMYERMLTQSRWLVGSIALFGTIISIVLAIGQFIK